MTDVLATNPLIAPKQDTGTWHTGINLLDDASALQQGIASGSWIESGLGALGTGMDTVALVTNPIATVVSYGLNYLVEKVKPLNDALNWLAGDAGQISAYAATWRNVSQSVGQSGQTFSTSLGNDTTNWTGQAATNYRDVATDTVDTLKAAATAAGTIGKATELIGSLVAGVRNLIRDLVTQAVGQIVQTALLALGVVTIPYVVARVAAQVAMWMRRIADVVSKLTSSLAKLQPLMARLTQLWSDIKQALGTRATKKVTGDQSHPTEPQPPAPNWPKKEDYTSPANFGTDKHSALAKIMRPFEGTTLKDGWEVAKVERTVGGTKRVDVMYVNHAQKRIVVEDYVTGASESVDHATKGWQYMYEPEIQNLRNQGYQYDYVPSFTEKLQ